VSRGGVHGHRAGLEKLSGRRRELETHPRASRERTAQGSWRRARHACLSAVDANIEEAFAFLDGKDHADVIVCAAHLEEESMFEFLRRVFHPGMLLANLEKLRPRVPMLQQSATADEQRRAE
jgi:hypothetical protein